MWLQKEFSLTAKSRGFHLVTREVEQALPELSQLKVGMIHLLLKHTSASLSLNENADPTVRTDFESFFSRNVPENEAYYIHTDEGPDDMPAHIKSSLLGVSVHLPVTGGRLNLGVWQGVYLGEHRNYGGSRSIIATLHGE